jgi:hypothetical protein
LFYPPRRVEVEHEGAGTPAIRPRGGCATTPVAGGRGPVDGATRLGPGTYDTMVTAERIHLPADERQLRKAPKFHGSLLKVARFSAFMAAGQTDERQVAIAL